MKYPPRMTTINRGSGLSGRVTLSGKPGGQRGFTIIELMIILGIVAILSAIAFPSYRSFMIKNKQGEAVADVLRLAGQLEQQRAKALTYAGFSPKEPYVYDSGSSDTITTKDYEIKIHTISQQSGSYTTSPIKSSNLGMNWIMTATPKDADAGLLSYAMTSNGIKCATPKKADVVMATILADKKCGAQSEGW